MNLKSLYKFAIIMVVPLFLFSLWWYVAVQIKNPVILPNVEDVIELLSNPTNNLISMGSLASNIIVSLVRVIVGYCLAALIAIPMGILMGYYSLVHNLLNNFIGLFRPIPPLAWVPLVLAWFGVSSLATLTGIEHGQWYIYLNNIKLSMIFIIFIGAFFPILTSSIYGVQSVNKTLLDSALVLGAKSSEVFGKILLPAAAPSIINGMRTGLGVAWMCLVAAEMLPGSLSGVGYLITHAYTIARTDIVIAGMISIGLVGALLDYLFRFIENKKFSWQHLAR
ncbi:MAG: ABC transporter permease [Peptococcaceae bacterium]|nr:ABC transporter permease [Candidatus Syntrophopropionicum ammoniitolerans]